MAGKARVHELAKELGVTSKEVLARLSEQGEFVKSASSTVEAPVARRLRESFGGAKPAADKVKADGNGAPAKAAPTAPAKAAAPKPAAPRRSPGRPGRTARRSSSSRARRARSACGPGSARSPRCAAQRRVRRPAPARPAAPEARRADPARRQQSVLLATAGRAADSASAGAPSGRPRPGAPRPGMSPGNMPPRPGWCPPLRVPAVAARPGGRSARPRWSWSRCRHRCGRPGGGGGGGGNYRGGAGGGAGGAGGGAPAGAGGAIAVVPAAAADPDSAAEPQAPSVVPAARPKRGRKSKRAKRAEYENMQAPVVGGVRLPHGNGETIRLARGASLSDFAEKIDANPACSGAGAVQPRRDGDRDAVRRRRDPRAARRRDELRRAGRVPGGRGPRAAGVLRPHLRRGRGWRGRPRDPSAGGDRHGSRRPRQDPTAGHDP